MKRGIKLMILMFILLFTTSINSSEIKVSYVVGDSPQVEKMFNEINKLKELELRVDKLVNKGR